METQQKSTLTNLKSLTTKYSARYVESFPIILPAQQIDLYQWIALMVESDYPNLFIKTAAWLNGLDGLFLKKHLRKEGKAFAKDIEQKFSLT